MRKKKEVPADASEEKEKISRSSMRHQRKARVKRRVILSVLLLVVAVLAVGGILDIPYINVAREAGSWLGDRLSGSGEEEVPGPEYAFLNDPRTMRPFADEVEILLALYRDDDPEQTILGTALLTYDAEERRGEIYLVPENTTTYNADGQQVILEDALSQDGGEDLLRSTVGNIAGVEVDYTIMLGFKEAGLLLQNLGFPPVEVQGEDMVLVNPLNGETNYLFAGHEIKDSDRLLFYLLATDEKGGFERRVERLSDYLDEALSRLAGRDTASLEEGMGFIDEEGVMEPSPGDAAEERSYLASMIQAFADLGEGSLTCRDVPQVEVLNGCGIPDLGKKVADELAALGISVSGSGGNAKVVVEGEEINDFTHEESSIVYQSEDPRVAAYARYLGVLLSITEVGGEPGPGPEIVLIAGRDMAV